MRRSRAQRCRCSVDLVACGVGDAGSATAAGPAVEPAPAVAALLVRSRASAVAWRGWDRPVGARSDRDPTGLVHVGEIVRPDHAFCEPEMTGPVALRAWPSDRVHGGTQTLLAAVAQRDQRPFQPRSHHRETPVRLLELRDRALDARASLSPANDRVSLSVPLPVTELAKGARAATSADLDEIFRLSPTPNSTPTPTSTPDVR